MKHNLPLLENSERKILTQMLWQIPVSISSGSAAGFAVAGAGSRARKLLGSQGTFRTLLYGLSSLDRRRELDIKDVFCKGAFCPLAL